MTQHPTSPTLLAAAILAQAMLTPNVVEAQQTTRGRQPPFKAWKHLYWEREHGDACSILLRKIQKGEATLDTHSESTFLRSLLEALDVPTSSQLLVYSATSVQRRVHPRNPRAIYFNEEVYVAMVPGAGVEAVGMDPEFGGVFYEFGCPQPGVPPVAEPSRGCFNCHVGPNSQNLPGLVIESLIMHPGQMQPQKFRDNTPGHQVPLAMRFGGWYVTSAGPLGDTKEGLVSAGAPGGQGPAMQVRRLTPAQRQVANNYPVASSDIVAHLVHEHQAGFHNLIMQAGFLCRDIAADNDADVTPQNEARLNTKADEVVRYILFADEAALPPGGVQGDAQFMRDFARNRRPGPAGAALKDFDLRTRIFKHRCSYMVYSSAWQKLHSLIKPRIYARLKAALTGEDPAFAYLPSDECRAILTILIHTLSDLPDNWPSRPSRLQP